MADLEHLAKEFEKVHDAIPKLLVRVSITEEWQRTHSDIHRLEGVALSIDREAVAQRMASMNELRKQIDSERGTFITRELYDRENQHMREEITDLRESRDIGSGEKGLLEKFWPLLLAAAMFIAGHWWR